MIINVDDTGYGEVENIIAGSTDDSIPMWSGWENAVIGDKIVNYKLVKPNTNAGHYTGTFIKKEQEWSETQKKYVDKPLNSETIDKAITKIDEQARELVQRIQADTLMGMDTDVKNSPNHKQLKELGKDKKALLKVKESL